MLLMYPIFLFFSIDRGATRTRNRSTHAIFVFFSSTREGTDFQWMKLNALRPTFVRNRERLNGCEIGETIRSKDCDRVDLSKGDKYDFKLPLVFLWPHRVKLILSRGVQQFLSSFFFLVSSPSSFFPPFFFRRMSDPPLFSWRVHASPIPECREFPRVEITSCPDFHRVSGPPMENEHQRLPPSWTRIVSNFRRELTNE